MIDLERLIDDVFVKEGDAYAEPPKIDQPTARGGITLAVLRECCGPQMTIADLRRLTHEDARGVVRWQLEQLAHRVGLDRIPYEPLRLQMIDYAYNSGPGLAIRWLQRVVGVPRTGVMDPTTVAAVRYPDLTRVPLLIHQALLAARLQMIDRATDPGGKVDHRYEEGLESRALTFSLLEVP